MANNYVFALYEVHHIEGAHMHSLFTTRKAALKSGLELKRKRVQEALDDYRLLGMKEAEYCYRNCWANVTVCVEKERVY